MTDDDTDTVDATTEETTDDTTEEERPPRRGRALLRPAAVALVIALAATGVLLLTEQRRDASPAANRALVDAQATATVVGDVSNALAKMFSYEHGDTAATQKAAANLLTGKASKEYKALFTQVTQQAPAQDLTLRTRVVRAAVGSLTPDTARLLVFLDQVATRKGKPAGGTAPAQLVVTARKQGGQWLIAEIRSS